MKDHIRSLIFGIFLVIVSVVFAVMNSCQVAIFTGVLSVVWMGKGFVEWWNNKKYPS